ncbi:PAP2 family protein [Anaerotruncus sp. 80]|uniref:Phosphatase PAP2 family protein n=1 Tax=Anaerotruncus colihominis TaxID=169435 RepID=A0A845QFV1_9FIRM|nr:MULTISPECIES: phosphatase PAP2 family protein [Anaerotruncus]NBH60750.1 phosphatase PAP2 family protein [Anaerotruncus colihominis]NCF01404.1 PAP2 family protein [Anaerotruncus sp. 80]
MNSESKKQIRAVIIGGALLCFAYVAYQISAAEVLSFDTAIREWVYARRNPGLNRVLITITYLGNWQMVSLMGIFLLMVKSTRMNMGIPFAVISLSSIVVYKAAKEIFQRPRPDFAVRLIEEGGYSFPSGHSMNGLVCYGILIYLIRRYCKNRKLANVLTGLLGFLIIAIGCSRVYVGVHYPTDIIGGWSLGAAYLCIAIIILEKVRGQKDDL